MMRDSNRKGQELKAWLIYDEERAAANRSYIQMHYETGERYGIRFQLLMDDEVKQILKQDTLAEYPDFAIVRTIAPNLSQNLENNSIPVFNPVFVSKICNDKGKTISYIKENTTIPVIETYRYDNRQLSESLLQAYPEHVIKSVDGHGGKQVFRTTDPFSRICQGIGGSDFIIQPFVRGEGKDIRVYVIGREIIGAVERTSPDGFRANFSLGGRVASRTLERKERQMTEEICRLFDFGMVGIDFILDEKGNFLFNEIEDVVGARMLYQCQPGIRLLEQYFAFIIDKLLHYA